MQTTISDPQGKFAIGVGYGANAEGGFGAFSATNVSSAVTFVFDPKTFQASIVYTASGAINSGYLKSYQSIEGKIARVCNWRDPKKQFNL